MVQMFATMTEEVSVVRISPASPPPYVAYISESGTAEALTPEPSIGPAM